ncbi:MAG: hypothetical protein J6U16_01095, partial [Ruminococcus sp.]|nr:hypothetical protein [Ruminococcus sp.]
FDYSVTIGEDYEAELLLDSDDQLYSGDTPQGSTQFSQDGACLDMDIPPYSGRLFLLRRDAK